MRRDAMRHQERSVAEERRRFLLRTLQDYGRPMATSELHELCPDEVIYLDMGWQCPCRRPERRGRIVRCHHGWIEELVHPGLTNVYQNLRQLANKGFVEWIKTPGVKVVCWQSVLNADEQAAFDAIVEAEQART